MKKSVILIATVCAVLVGTVLIGANAKHKANNGIENIFQAEIAQRSESDVYRVSVLNKTENPVYVAIRNEKGKIVYGEKITDTRVFRKNYNMSRLPEGQYTINVIGFSGETVTQVIEVK